MHSNWNEMSINRIIKKKKRNARVNVCMGPINLITNGIFFLYKKYEKLIPSNYRLFIKNTKPNLLLFQNGMSEGESEWVSERDLVVCSSAPQTTTMTMAVVQINVHRF